MMAAFEFFLLIDTWLIGNGLLSAMRSTCSSEKGVDRVLAYLEAVPAPSSHVGHK